MFTVALRFAHVIGQFQNNLKAWGKIQLFNFTNFLGHSKKGELNFLKQTDSSVPKSTSATSHSSAPIQTIVFLNQDSRASLLPCSGSLRKDSKHCSNVKPHIIQMLQGMVLGGPDSEPPGCEIYE